MDTHLPRAVVRMQARALVRPMIYSDLPIALRRSAMDLLGQLPPSPAGTSVAKGRIGGLPALRVAHESAESE